MSANGKVDRKALLRLDEEATPEAPERVDGRLPDIDPRNEYEKKIHAVWSDVLGRSDFGVMASWRDLGGKSLGLMSMSYRVAEKLEIEEIGFDVLQRHRTIASLATFLQAAKAPPAPPLAAVKKTAPPSRAKAASTQMAVKKAAPPSQQQHVLRRQREAPFSSVPRSVLYRHA